MLTLGNIYGEYSMKIDIAACFNYGIEKVKGNPMFYIAGFFLVAGIGVAFKLIAQGFGFVFSIMLQSFFGLSNKAVLVPEYIAATLVGIVLSFFLAPFLLGYFRGIRKEYEGGTAEPLDVLLGVDALTPSVANFAVASIVFLAGFACVVVPGIIVAPLLYLTIFYLAHDELTGLAAFTKAVDTLKKNPVLILWNLIFGLFAALGLLVCLVGVLVTAPVAICATYVLFMQVAGEEVAKPAVFLEDENSDSDDLQGEDGNHGITADMPQGTRLTENTRTTNTDSPYKLK